jgi:hypothetical protein
MNEDQIRAELLAVKATLREGTADIADLLVRFDSVSSSLTVLIGQRRKPMTALQEHNWRKLVELWSEVKAALEARGAVR